MEVVDGRGGCFLVVLVALGDLIFVLVVGAGVVAFLGGVARLGLRGGGRCSPRWYLDRGGGLGLGGNEGSYLGRNG